MTIDVPIKVLIVDDQRMFREGIRSRLETEPDMRVVGEAGSLEETITLIAENHPDIVTLDIRLPDASGIEIAKRIRKSWPGLKILMLTGYDFDQYVRASARAGIDGYLLKDAPQEDLISALREIAAGGAVLPPHIASKVMKTYSEEPVSPNPPMRSGLGVGTRGEGRGTRRSALDSDKWGRWRPLVGVGGADGGPGQRRWGGVGGTACKGRQSRTGPVRLCGVVE